MGVSHDYPNVPDWVAKSEGYQTGAMVKYHGNLFYANFWGSEPGVGDAAHNGWRFYDELYDQTSHTPTDQAKIIAYIPTWRKKEGFNYANEEMYQYITHGIIAFLMFSETRPGEFDPTSVSEVTSVLFDVVSTAHRHGTRISIALGGATDYGFLNLMTSIGNDPATPLLDKAIQNVVTFVTLNNLDGVDLDLECWWDRNGDPSKDQGGRPKSQGPRPAGLGLTLFAQQLKHAMPEKLVSATLFGTSWYGNNYDSRIADHVDWLAIMTYDLTGSWNASPVGPHTALSKLRNQESSKIRIQDSYQESYVQEQQGEWPGGGIVNNPILSVEDTLWYWTNPLFVNWQGAGQNVPRNKIAAGVPIYGYDFAYGKDPDDRSGQIPPGYKVLRYKDILSHFPDAHTAAKANIKVAGQTPRPPFVAAPGTYPYTNNIYFETPATAVTKLNFLKSVGAHGVIIWELSNDVWEDSKSIIKALYNNSGNPPKPAIPSSLMLDQISGQLLGVEQIPGGLYKTRDMLVKDITLSDWPAVAVYDNKIYCLFKRKNDYLLWGTSFDGEGLGSSSYIRFTTDLIVHDPLEQGMAFVEVPISGAPALAIFNGLLYCFHQRDGNSGELWYTTYGDQGRGYKQWSEDKNVPGVRLSKAPAVTVFRDRIFCVHEGMGDDGRLWYTTFDGNAWSTDSEIAGSRPSGSGMFNPRFATSGTPGLVVFNEKLYCFHKGNNNSELYCQVFDGNTWSDIFWNELSSNTQLSKSPAVVVFQAKLYCFHEGRGDNGELWFVTYDGNTWSKDQRVSDAGTSGPPGLAVYNNELYCLHQGYGDNGELWNTVFMEDAANSPWREMRGDNAYCYCVCNSSATKQSEGMSHTHTVNVDAGAPYLYAVLTKDDDTVDFPTGASLTIQDPDGTKYDRALQDETRLVIMSGSSVRCLVIKDPKPGNWTMMITTSASGDGVFCTCGTVPSKDVYTTIVKANSRALQKRSLESFVGFVVFTAVAMFMEASASRRYHDFLDAATRGQQLNPLPALDGPSVERNATQVSQIAALNGRPVIAPVTLAVTTWNMQGGANFDSFVSVAQNARNSVRDPRSPNATVVQVIALQETGDLSDVLGRNRRGAPSPLFDQDGSRVASYWTMEVGNLSTYAVLFWENRWTQGGLGIFSNVHPTMRNGREQMGIIRPVDVLNVNPGNPRNIPWVTVTLPSSPSREVTILTMHAPPVWNLTNDQVVVYVSSQIENIVGQLPGRSWILLGDFNIDPNSLERDVNRRLLNIQVVNGGRATQQQGEVLDYAVTNIRGLRFVQVDSLASGSDHYPQTFAFRID